MCLLLRAGPGGRVTKLLETFLGSQLFKPRLCLVATDRVHVTIAVIINAIVSYIFTFMYLLEIKLLLLDKNLMLGAFSRDFPMSIHRYNPLGNHKPCHLAGSGLKAHEDTVCYYDGKS